MDLHKAKKHLQEHFETGLVTVVGSGVSAAEGVAGMATLTSHLKRKMPAYLNGKRETTWPRIEALLGAGKDLETALLEQPPSRDAEAGIVQFTTELISAGEMEVVARTLSGVPLRLQSLLPHLPPSGEEIPIVTTNYDRLVEIAAELSGIEVDTSFVGSLCGRYSPSESRRRFTAGIVRGRKNGAYIRQARRVLLMKPHGSLDWYSRAGTPIRLPFETDLPRLVITPGLNKYRAGYESPFDAHREAANALISKAGGLLFLGYGFNDDHLQVHLLRRIKEGVPALFVNRDLSSAAKDLTTSFRNVSALVAHGRDGAELIHRSKSHPVFDKPVWDIRHFVAEVLEP